MNQEYIDWYLTMMKASYSKLGYSYHKSGDFLAEGDSYFLSYLQ